MASKINPVIEQINKLNKLEGNGSNPIETLKINRDPEANEVDGDIVLYVLKNSPESLSIIASVLMFRPNFVFTGSNEVVLELNQYLSQENISQSGKDLLDQVKNYLDTENNTIENNGKEQETVGTLGTNEEDSQN